MKYLLFIAITISLSFLCFAQNKHYTKGYENGHSWNYFEDRPSIYSSPKFDYLSSILTNEKLNEMRGTQNDPLFCYNDIELLGYEDNSDEIYLEDIIKLIDEFYSDEFNLVIPIRYAYCYAIKKMRDVDEDELRKYKVKLLVFAYND